MITPTVPKIPPQLNEWVDDVGASVEIDRAFVKSVDFAGVSRFSTDLARIETSSLTGVALDKLELTDTEGKRRGCNKLRSRGATISQEQLVQLAPLLASELGFRVKD